MSGRMADLPVSLPLGVALLGLLLVIALGSQVVLRSRRPEVPVMRPARAGAPLLAGYRGIGRSAVGSVVAAAVLLALLALAQSQGPAGFDPGQGGSGAGRRTADAYQSGILDLRQRGRLPDTPLYRVPADSPVLWRSAFLGEYSGQTWTPAGVDFDDVVLGSGDVRPLPSPLDPVPPGGGSRSDRVQQLRGARSLIVPGTPLRLVLDPAVPVLSTPSTGQLDTAVSRPVAYTVTSVPRPGTEDLRAGTPAGEPAGTDLADPQWLDLPSSVTGRTRQLSARLVAGRPSRLDAVLTVEQHLRSSYRYTLDSPVPAPGADAVDDFLFVSREGFCEQFASAEVVLLRAAGIPARLATGFAGGKQEGAARVVRASEAHAWVEVWLPGLGWVSSDPTAGTVPAESPGDTLRSWLSAHRWLLLALAAALLLAGFLLRRWLRSPGRGVDRRPAATGVEADRLAALEALDRLEAALRAAGLPRQPAESLPRLAARLDGYPDAAAALDVYQRMAFAARPPEPERSRWAAQALDRISEQLVAEAVDRQGAPATAPR